MRAREVNVLIERRGGRVIRQVGSHRRYGVDYTRPDGTTGRAVTIVAQHPGDIPTGTLRKIEPRAGIGTEVAHAMSTSENGSYRVLVTREDGQWLATVDGLAGAHTYARTLATLERFVREVVVLAADLDESASEDLRLDLDISTGDAAVDEATAEVRAARAEVEQATSLLRERTSATAVALVDAGWSVRDAAVVLDVSPQRVSQLTSGVAARRTSTRADVVRAPRP